MSQTDIRAQASEPSLAGFRIAVTRAADPVTVRQSELLKSLGADVVNYPCLEIHPPKNLEQLDSALQKAVAGEFDWLVLTTANTVFMLEERMKALGVTPVQLNRIKIATIGANTHRIVEEDLKPLIDQVPETYSPEELVAAMKPRPGERVLLPQSLHAKPALANLLHKTGAIVTTVVAYRDVIGQGGDQVPAMLWEGNLDAITFVSEANVRYFAKRLQYDGGSLSMLDDVCVVCMGPITAQAARSFGLRVDIVPEQHTVEGLVGALAASLSRYHTKW